MTLPFDPETLDLEPLLKRLHLAYARREWARLCATAEAEGWSPRKLLAVLFSEEIAQRRNTRLQREVRRCGFPFLRTIDEFDFSLQTALRQSLLGSYLGPELVSEGRSLILCGKTGRGKTHLAIAIAYKAIQNGFTARFVTAAELISDLSDAMRAVGSARRSLRTPAPTPWPSMRSDTSPTATMPRTCSSTSSTTATCASGRCCSPRTSPRSASGEPSSTTTTWPTRSSTGSWSAGDCSCSTDRRIGPETCRVLTLTGARPNLDPSTGQSFRNQPASFSGTHKLYVNARQNGRRWSRDPVRAWVDV
jgi:hypothetical protein